MENGCSVCKTEPITYHNVLCLDCWFLLCDLYKLQSSTHFENEFMLDYYNDNKMQLSNDVPDPCTAYKMYLQNAVNRYKRINKML